MSNRLATLRAQLAGLRRARSGVRAAVAWSALGIAVLSALAVVFALDLIFELAVPQRIVVLIIAAAAVAWAFWRFTRPLLGVHEGEIEMALLVERQQQIDSDLVAALQFESPQARDWGSPQLETAVIDYVAAVGRGINVFEGFSQKQMARRLGLLGAGLAAALVAAAIWPGHFTAFFNRLLLGSRHYPTRTVIEQVLVNRTPVLMPGGGNAPAGSKAAQGRPVTFLVQCTGELPPVAAAQLAASGASRGRTRLELKPLTMAERLARLDEARRRLQAALAATAGRLDAPWKAEMSALLLLDAPGVATALAKAELHSDLPAVITGLGQATSHWPGDRPSKAIYAGELSRLNDSVSYKLLAGDAWTDPAELAMIPLPIVEMRLTPVPPKYAQSAAAADPDPSGRQLAVLEGSAVDLEIECTNAKQLKSAWLTIQTKAGTQRFDLAPHGANGAVWKPRVATSPLKSIQEEMRYEVQVLDSDGLSLETPLRGTIRIRPDRPPSGLAEVVHKVVLPTAAPVVEYRASDDFGISRLALVAEIERGSESPRPQPVEPAGELNEDPQPTATDLTPAAAIAAETHRIEMLTQPRPLVGAGLPVQGQHAFSLAPLKLAKGDRVKLTLEVTDYRGENKAGQPAGVAYQSDPLILEISDESGVLAAISEADPRSEERLTDIIKRQLGIGESP